MDTMTRPSIRCGHCEGRHATVAEVRNCAATPKTPGEWYALNIERAAAQHRELVEEDRRAAAAKMDRDSYYVGEPRTETQKLSSARSTVAEDGMYRNPETGEIFKVQWNRGSGDGRRLYAKQLIVILGGPDTAFYELARIPLTGEKIDVWGSEFRYAPGAIKTLRPEWRLTMDEAKQFGALYGTCIRCGRTLTLEESIERAMGRICASKI